MAIGGDFQFQQPTLHHPRQSNRRRRRRRLLFSLTLYNRTQIDSNAYLSTGERVNDSISLVRKWQAPSGVLHRYHGTRRKRRAHTHRNATPSLAFSTVKGLCPGEAASRETQSFGPSARISYSGAATRSVCARSRVPTRKARHVQATQVYTRRQCWIADRSAATLTSERYRRARWRVS